MPCSKFLVEKGLHAPSLPAHPSVSELVPQRLWKMDTVGNTRLPCGMCQVLKSELNEEWKVDPQVNIAERVREDEQKTNRLCWEKEKHKRQDREFQLSYFNNSNKVDPLLLNLKNHDFVNLLAGGHVTFNTEYGKETVCP